MTCVDASTSATIAPRTLSTIRFNGSLPKAMYWMGVDIGTGGTRALLIDAAGREVAAVTAPHEDMRMEHPGWAEQRPEKWWDAASQAIRGVLGKAGISGEVVRGIGLSGQMHGLVIL